MHTVQSARPSPALRRYVRAYAQRELHGCSTPVIGAQPARLEQILKFEFGDPYELRFDSGERRGTHTTAIIGYQTYRRCDIVMSGSIETFAVFFQPAGFSHIFNMPLRDLTNQIYEAGSVLGKSIYTLWARTGESATFEGRVRIVEQFLLWHLERAHCQDGITAAADYILAVAGAVRIADIANQNGLGLRQFERRFLAETGCPPKRYARVARFQTALDMKLASPHRSWLEIAHELNYHDQMHMVHDFQSLAGDSPSRILGELGDTRPPALVTTER
jgi:AraC-like DNA-binding protein